MLCEPFLKLLCYLDHRSEVFLMMRTLRDMNMSKFVAEDVPLFLSLIDDLFPGLKADRASFPEISAALRKVRNFSNNLFDDLHFSVFSASQI